jgi:hypothetical protein
MSLSELHPFVEAEVATVPAASGLYMLFQVENPIHADQADNLRQRLRQEKHNFPRATHFSVESGYAGEAERAARLAQVRAELQRVRSRTFIGGR